MSSWGIIGGGILGMTLAHRLASMGQQVTIFEAGPFPGGLLETNKLKKYEWDSFYHVILKSDSHLRSLLREIDPDLEINWVETKTGFHWNGDSYSMSNIFEFMKFPPLNVIDKIRLAITILYASREKNWRRLEKISLEDWLLKLSGRNTYNKIWVPLLRAKLGENYKISSAVFIWATIQRMYAARKSGLKKEMFGYVNGGYKEIITKFLERLDRDAVIIKTGHGVTNVLHHNNGTITVTFRNGTTADLDRVILTIPSEYIPEVCPLLSADEKLKHNKIRYLGVICVSVLLKKPLSGFYVTNILDENIPFTGVIEMTALVNKSKFDGNTLVYLPQYINSDDKDFALTDEDIKFKFLGALLKMYPEIKKEDILAAEVSKAKNVFALPTLSYSQNLPPIQTSIPGLYVINSAQIVNGTLNVNETISLADYGLKRILNRDITKNLTLETAEM